MENKIKDLLDAIMIAELEDFKSKEGTPEQRKAIVDNLVKLNGLKKDQQEDRHKSEEHNLKVIMSREEHDLKIISFMEEHNTKAKASKREVVFKGLEVAVSVTGIVLPIVFYTGWFHQGLDFEKEGTFCSNTLKNLYSKFKPTM